VSLSQLAAVCWDIAAVWRAVQVQYSVYAVLLAACVCSAGLCLPCGALRDWASTACILADVCCYLPPHAYVPLLRVAPPTSPGVQPNDVSPASGMRLCCACFEVQVGEAPASLDHPRYKRQGLNFPSSRYEPFPPELRSIMKLTVLKVCMVGNGHGLEAVGWRLWAGGHGLWAELFCRAQRTHAGIAGHGRQHNMLTVVCGSVYRATAASPSPVRCNRPYTCQEESTALWP